MPDFELQSSGGPAIRHDDRAAFAPPSNNSKCRTAIYVEVKAARPATVFLRDLERQFTGIFRSVTMYQAAKDLVTAGILARKDVRAVSVHGGGAVHGRTLIGLRYVEPFESASRLWK